MCVSVCVRECVCVCLCLCVSVCVCLCLNSRGPSAFPVGSPPNRISLGAPRDAPPPLPEGCGGGNCPGGQCITVTTVITRSFSINLYIMAVDTQTHTRNTHTLTDTYAKHAHAHLITHATHTHVSDKGC